MGIETTEKQESKQPSILNTQRSLFGLNENGPHLYQSAAVA